jgi:hypothetical protein
MYFVDFHGLRTQDHTSILTLSQEHGLELSIALDSSEESEISTF